MLKASREPHVKHFHRPASSATVVQGLCWAIRSSIDIGPNILRWHQSNIVSSRIQPMPQMARPAARFQADAAWPPVVTEKTLL
jgi:hypothetical protein